jgi:hypothetical protein
MPVGRANRVPALSYGGVALQRLFYLGILQFNFGSTHKIGASCDSAINKSVQDAVRRGSTSIALE